MSIKSHFTYLLSVLKSCGLSDFAEGRMLITGLMLRYRKLAGILNCVCCSDPVYDVKCKYIQPMFVFIAASMLDKIQLFNACHRTSKIAITFCSHNVRSATKPNLEFGSMSSKRSHSRRSRNFSVINLSSRAQSGLKYMTWMANTKSWHSIYKAAY